MFNWLFRRKSKSKNQVQSIIKLRHKDGEEIIIQISGKTAEKVSYVTNIIKEKFRIENISDMRYLSEEMKNLGKEIFSTFNDLSKNFKNFLRNKK